ncbi:SMI1/KNR4 family protein [Ureibacillus sp. NPDC094379]
MEWILKKELNDQQKISAFEQQYQLKFPQQFKELVMQHHAARPEPYIIDAEITKEIPAKALLSFDENHKPEDIWSSYEAIKDRLPVNIIPFMSDEGGNYFCFDFDPLEEEANIVYWTHENNNIQFVAQNLQQFIGKFYDF